MASQFHSVKCIRYTKAQQDVNGGMVMSMVSPTMADIIESVRAQYPNTAEFLSVLLAGSTKHMTTTIDSAINDGNGVEKIVRDVTVHIFLFNEEAKNNLENVKIY